MPTQLHNKSVLCLALLLDGKLVSGSRDCNIKIWHPASGRFVTTLNGRLKSVNALTVLPDDALVSASADMTIKLWNVGNGHLGENDLGSCTCIATLAGHKSTVRSLSSLATGSLLSGADDCAMRIWGKDGNLIRIIDDAHTGAVSALAASEGSFCSVRWDRSLRIFDSKSYRMRESFLDLHYDRTLSISLLADNRIIAAGADKNIYISVCKL